MTPTPLDTPAWNVVTANPDGSMTVEWEAVAGAGYYEIERAIALSGPWAVVGVAIGTMFTDPKDNVVVGTEYHYRVQAFAGELVQSNVAPATTEGGVSPLTLAGGLGALGLAGLGGYYLFKRRSNGGTA